MVEKWKLSWVAGMKKEINMLDAKTCKDKMARFLKKPMGSLEEGNVLMDLVNESFLLVELVIELQEEFGLRLVQEDLRLVRTVGDLVQVLLSKST